MAGLRGRALVAYLIVCVVWGSTYLAIRVAVTHLPPFLMAGVRFLIAGAVLAAVVRMTGVKFPTNLRAWLVNSVVGTLLLAGGNGGVVWAEQFTASGTTSIIVVTVAVWTAFFDAVTPGGTTTLTWRVGGGLVAALAGTFVLTGLTPDEIFSANLRGLIGLTLASISWAFGTVFSKRNPVGTSPYVASAIQMLVGGTVLTVVGLTLGEPGRWHWTQEGTIALGYLIVFGSLVGFTAYAYALRHMSPTILGTYAYVNPVVAVLLGWVFLREPITARTLLGMGIVLGAVVWMQMSKRQSAKAVAISVKDTA
ncbi:MAG TPA: EamA family transporter [Chthoniobacterales bacterium]